MTQLPPQVPSPPHNIVLPKQKKGLAIGGFVLGSLSALVLLDGIVGHTVPMLIALVAAMLLATGGIVLSTVALVRKTAGHRLAYRGLELSVLSVLACLLVLWAIAPYLAKSWDVSKAARCSMNLSDLGKAIEVYQSNSHGQFPPNLAVLLNEGRLSSPQILRCPKDNSPKTSLIGSSYFYCVPEDDASARTTIIACDVALHHYHDNSNAARIYLLANLSVQRGSESYFQQLLQMPENRRFADELAKGIKMTPYERVTYTVTCDESSRHGGQADTAAKDIVVGESGLP